MLLNSLVACTLLILAVSAQQTEIQLNGEECVSREEFESLKEEVAGQLEKRDQDIRSLKRALLLDGLDDKLELLHYKLDEVQEDIRSFNPTNQSQICDANTAPGLSPWNPAYSCKQLAYRYPTAPSGHYWVLNGSGVAVESYCDMKRRCCGSTGGWMRVAHFDMTDLNHYCSEGFRLFPGPKRLCTRDASGSGCTSIHFSTHGVLYSRVCGKVIGYQHERPDAFAQYHEGLAVNIDEPYVDGVSITHGSPNRRHIWTFAGARDETRADYTTCPCTKTDTTFTGTIPPFVRNDYFCDTGSRNAAENRLYYEDALWDGKGCGPTSSCCQFNSPPYFCKVLPQATTDDIEVRLCEWFAGGGYNEDTPIEAIELFIQ